jgi:hypothetical protein
VIKKQTLLSNNPLGTALLLKAALVTMSSLLKTLPTRLSQHLSDHDAVSYGNTLTREELAQVSAGAIPVPVLSSLCSRHGI